MMTQQLRFKEAALLTQEKVAAEDKGELQAMLFAMLQEQHGKKNAAMTATNKFNMDTMMERMNALMTGGGGRQPTHQQKEITPTIGSMLSISTGSGTNQPPQKNRQKCICPNCKMFVLHKPESCVELETNKDMCWPARLHVTVCVTVTIGSGLSQ